MRLRPRLSVAAGAHIVVTIKVVNPTSGTVSLPTPLSCAPTLRGPKGAVFGSTFCEQMTQQMAPHSKLTQHYTIYATDTAAAGGNSLNPAVYTLTFENLFRTNVDGHEVLSRRSALRSPGDGAGSLTAADAVRLLSSAAGARYELVGRLAGGETGAHECRSRPTAGASS